MPLYVLFGIGRGVFESTSKAVFADFFQGPRATAGFANSAMQNGLSGSIGFFIFPMIDYHYKAYIVVFFGGACKKKKACKQCCKCKQYGVAFYFCVHWVLLCTACCIKPITPAVAPSARSPQRRALSTAVSTMTCLCSLLTMTPARTHIRTHRT